MSPRASLDMMEKKKISCPIWESNPLSSSLISVYTDPAILPVIKSVTFERSQDQSQLLPLKSGSRNICYCNYMQSPTQKLITQQRTVVFGGL
jgi:hypothetical protein